MENPGELSLEDLILLAIKHRLIDDGRVKAGSIHLRLGNQSLVLTDEEEAQALVFGLLRGRERAIKLLEKDKDRDPGAG